MLTPPLHGVVLFAHGSRDPRWHLPIQAVEQHIACHQPEVRVCCAYLELSTPDLATAVQQLLAQGVTSITVVPMFLGTGKHAREDLPLLLEALRAQHPQLRLTAQPAIGEDPRMTALMATIATEPLPA